MPRPPKGTNFRHGHTGAKWGKRGMSPTYSAWAQARRPDAKEVTPNHWGTFRGFLADMGERPVGTVLRPHDSGLWIWHHKAPRVQPTAATPVPRTSEYTPHPSHCRCYDCEIPF